jgi:zinc-ribbon domain
MIYNWKLATGHQISVDNEGAQTIVTVMHDRTGSQQRTSNSFTTGIWIAPPTLTMTPTGGSISITTPSGECTLQIDGNRIHLQSDLSNERQSTISSSSSTFTSSTASGSPPMSVNLNTGTTTTQRRFCTECGTLVKPTDKFCASCGQKLES